MSLSPGEEFNLRATPSPALWRKLAYLAAQDNGSVLIGGVTSPRAAYSKAAGKAFTPADAIMMARLADPAYQALSAQINDDLERMDEASVIALQDIEAELRVIREIREKIRAQAYHDEQGRMIVMTPDGSAAFYDDGTQLPESEFAAVKPHLHGRPTWDKWQDLNRQEDALRAERHDIHRHDAARDRLHDDLNTGAVSAEDARLRLQEIEASLPDRVRRSYSSPTDEPAPQSTATTSTALSVDELASLGTRDGPRDPAENPTPPPPGAAPF